MKKFNYELTILEHHLDTFGHVNNAVYLELCEEARWDLITRNGFGLKEVRASKKGPVILEVHVKYLKELRLRERIRIESACVDYTRVVADLQQNIYNEDGQVSAECLFKFALFDTEKRKIIRPTPEWLKALGIG